MVGKPIDEVRYRTDDRDANAPTELVITMGKNGDWYVAVVPAGEGTIGRSVRLCTSGGASFNVPGLCPAIMSAFVALSKSQSRGVTHRFADGEVKEY